MNYTSKQRLLGTKGNRWDNSKFLKISAVLLTSAVVSGGAACR